MSRASGVKAMPLAPAGRSDWAARSSARACTVSAKRERGASASTRFHSRARWPRRPSGVVQKKSARSRRTRRLSTSRVKPPVPGNTANRGSSGERHGAVAVIHQKDFVARQGQLVAAARSRAVDGADVGLAGMFGGVFDAVSRFVGELAEIDLVGVRGATQHADVGAGAKHLRLAGCHDERRRLPGARSADAGRRRKARCPPRDRRN